MADVVVLQSLSPLQIEHGLEEMLRTTEQAFAISHQTSDTPDEQRWPAVIADAERVLQRADQYRRQIAVLRRTATDEEVTQRLIMFVGSMKRGREHPADSALLVTQMRADVLAMVPSIGAVDRALRILRTQKCDWLPSIREIVQEVTEAEEFLGRSQVWLDDHLPRAMQGAQARVAKRA